MRMASYASDAVIITEPGLARASATIPRSSGSSSTNRIVSKCALPIGELPPSGFPRESQEMVFDAHDRAFAFFRGACRRGLYDNMKTAVDTVFLGKDRVYNRRFLQLCAHYLVEPTACTPAAGWEKGQV